jgi:Tfp pilus assembly protein PilO
VNRKPQLNLWSCWEIDAIGAVVCIVLTAAVYFFGVSPVLDAHARDVAQQDQARAKQRAASAANNALLSMQHQLKLATAQATSSPLRLKPASQLNNRLAEITGLAQDAGMQIEDVHPGSNTHGRRFDTIPITISGKGCYITCVQFLHELRTTYADTGVSSFHLTGNPSDPAAMCDFSFSLDWFAATEQR